MSKLEDLRAMTLEELQAEDVRRAEARAKQKDDDRKVAQVIAEKMEAAELERLEADAAAAAAEEADE